MSMAEVRTALEEENRQLNTWVRTLDNKTDGLIAGIAGDWRQALADSLRVNDAIVGSSEPAVSGALALENDLLESCRRSFVAARDGRDGLTVAVLDRWINLFEAEIQRNRELVDLLRAPQSTP